jgi:hypothetical protein|tara:strand:- start:27654 stop:29084 length:1431 start_codon:yes stop_codon:yes gene_type:complete
MKNFMTFREDLASGRPAKKPVSSNLLQQRAKANTKALKSGFMRLTKQERDKEARRMSEEKKNCGCGQDPCITYGKKQMKEAIDTKPVHDANKALEKNMGLKKTKDSGIVKTKGGYARKRTYTRESARDNYNPEISDKRTKEKLKKAGLPPESPKVMEARERIRDIFEGKKKGLDGKACWKGYKLQGTKKKGNKTVDNCVPMSEEEQMKPHKMYKGDKVVVAKNKAEHDKLNKQGYTHDDPKTKKIEEVSDHLKTRYIHKSMRDIDTKERASQLADKQGAPASVGKSLSKSTGKRRKGIARARANLERPIREGKKPVVHSTKPDSLKMVKIKYNKPIKTKVTDIGPGGKEVVRKDWSEGIERDPKSNSFNRTKRKETTVRVGQKRDKKTGKMVDVMGKSSAPQGLPSMKEHQIQLVTNLDFNESLGMLVSRGLNKVRGAIKDAEKRTGYKVDPSKNKHSNPVSGKNIAKRLASQKKR